jgi:hypothetical protein
MMGQRIKIRTGQLDFNAELNETATAKAVLEALPITGYAQRWGGEIYFSIPVEAQLQADSREVLEAGELGYWPSGKAFCIFFGPTPASRGDEIRAASAVNILGKITDDLSVLWDIPDGAEIAIESF